MARRALSYSVLNIGGQNDETPAPPEPQSPAQVEAAESKHAPVGKAAPNLETERQNATQHAGIRRNDPAGHLVKHRAQQVMIYMRPEAHKALTRYALEQTTFRNKIKPHDLLVEAVQEWFDKHGLREQVKVLPEKGRGD